MLKLPWTLRVLPLALLLLALLLLAPVRSDAQAIPVANADVNGDCAVNVTDANLVKAANGKTSTQPGYSQNLDVNRDGKINTTDLTFVTRNNGAKVCSEPPPNPPAIATSITPAANANGWHSSDVTVQFTCTNAMSCPAPVVVSTEGRNQIVSRTVANAAGATATANVTLNIDKTPPVLTVGVPPSAAPSAAIFVTVSSVDLSGLVTSALKIDGVAAGSRTSAPFDITPALPPGVPPSGVRLLEIRGTDAAGNTAVATRTIRIVVPDAIAPTVTLSAPAIAAPGAQIPLTASAEDNAGVVKLSIQEAGSLTPLREITSGPFVLQQPFTVPDVPNGTEVMLLARAEDGAGNAGTATVTVKVERTVDGPALTLQVDPPVTPTFQPSAVIRGRINSANASVVPTAPPFITSLTRTTGLQGETLDVGIVAANTAFDAATTSVTFGVGISVLQLTVTGPGNLVARIAIDPKASFGPRIVAVSTGSQEALAPNAFTIVAGNASVSGRLVSSAPGHARIAGARVCAPGTALCTASGGDGSFALANVPTTVGRLAMTAAGFETLSVPVVLRLGDAVALGELTMAALNEPPPPPEPGAPVLPGALGSAVARMSAVFTQPETLTPERARKLVIDSILLVGGDELGVLDSSGAQLNPDVTGAGPLSLSDEAVTLQARGLNQGASTSLEELWFAMVIGFEWTAPGAPSLDDFVAALQHRVDEAWANPSAPESPLAILLFNRGAAFSKLAPRIDKSTRVNGLQALFIYMAPLLEGYYQKTGITASTLPVTPDVMATNGPGGSWLTKILRATTGLLSAGRMSATLGLQPRLTTFGAPRLPVAARTPGRPPVLEQGGGGAQPHAVRQLSRSLQGAAQGFVKSLAFNIAGNVLFGMPAAAASGGLLGVTLFTAAVGAMTDTFLFSAIGVALAVKLSPPPPEIQSVTQVGNRVQIKIARVPLDLRCRTELLNDPQSTAGLCNFQYTLYRGGAGATRVVVARLVPRFNEDDPAGVFTVEDNFPNVGGNVYFADVVHKFPMSLTPEQQIFAGMISLPTKVGIPIGNVLSLFFLTELVSDFSEPNPFPQFNFRNSGKADWDRVRVTFAPVPPTHNFEYLRGDRVKNVFAADTGFKTISQIAPGGANINLAPAFGRMVGVDADAAGNVYSLSDMSQAKFGGRVFQLTPAGAQNFIGTVNKYSPLLDFGRPVNVSALALGPKAPGQNGAFVPGDVFVADNQDRTVKRLITSLIPATGISGLPAPGGGIFGALAASPIVAHPYLQLPSCAGDSRTIRDMVFDRANNLWMLVGQELYKVPYDAATGSAMGLVAAADLNGGSLAPPSLVIKVRDHERDSLSLPLKGRAFLTAENSPCTGTLEWSTSDVDVVSYEVKTSGDGFSRIEIRGKKPGTATLTARFATPGGKTSAERSVTVKVLETGPILFVHGWIGSGNGWDPVIKTLVGDGNGHGGEGLLDGGSLCARWVKDRGRFVRSKASVPLQSPIPALYLDIYRPGNSAAYRCDQAAEDGAVFTLNFDDNQNSFIDTAGELSDIVDQITRAVGGEDCKTLPNDTSEWPEACPRLTLVAHSMGGQTSRAFIQSVPHRGVTAADYPAGAVGIPEEGLRLGMPFRPFRGQVKKLVTIGTMNMGTPAPNLTEDESLIFWLTGILQLAEGAAGIDPFSPAILSMRVGSPEWQLLSNFHINDLKQLELVSIVTQASGPFTTNFCAVLGGGGASAPQLFELLPLKYKAVLTGLAAIAGSLIGDFETNILSSLHTKLCGAGADLGPVALVPPVLGSIHAPPGFYFNSDMIVGVDSQNVNNLFRYLAGQPISYAFVNEPGGLANAPAKVVTVPNMLHTEDTAAADVIREELDLTAPDPSGSAVPDSTLVQPANAPAVATVMNPRGLAVDAAGNVFISDAATGGVTVVRTDTFANTFVNGIAGIGAIAVNGAYLFASRGEDVIRVPLGISGTVQHGDGSPARNASITVRGAGGFQARAVNANGNGNFSIPLESLGLTLVGDQLNVFLTVATEADAQKPATTKEVIVPMSVGLDGARVQTTVTVDLGD